MNQEYEDEREVSLSGMLFYVLKRWRILCIFLVIGLVIGSAFSLIKKYQSSPEHIIKKAEKLTEDDIKLEQIRQYIDYRELYKLQLENEANSILLSLDPEAVWTGEIRYFITGTKDNIDAISAVYQSLLRRDNNIQKMMEAYGTEITERQIRDLVSTSFSKNVVDSDISLQDSYDLRTGIAGGNVTAPNEETCIALMNTVQQIIETTGQSLSEEYGSDFSCNLLNRFSQYGYGSNVQNAKQSAAELRKEYLTQITALENSFSDDDELYVQYLQNMNGELELKPANFSKKWPVIFALGGVVFTAGILLVIYLLDNHIKNAKDLTDYYGLKMLAYLSGGQEKKRIFIDRWLEKWENKTKIPRNDENYLRAVLNNLDFKTAILSWTTNNGADYNFVETILADDHRLINVGNLATDSKAQEKMKEADGIILLVPLFRAREPELERVIRVSEGCGKEILGVIAIDK